MKISQDYFGAAIVTAASWGRASDAGNVAARLAKDAGRSRIANKLSASCSRRAGHPGRHDKPGASMFAKLAICLLLIATPALAQEAQEVPDTLALSDEDAQTCKVKGCRTITDAAYEMIAQRLRRAEELEAIAQRLARELAKKPAPQFCS